MNDAVDDDVDGYDGNGKRKRCGKYINSSQINRRISYFTSI